MNVSVAPGPLAAVGYLPLGRSVGEGAESLVGGLPSTLSDLGAGPCLPITFLPYRPGACRAGLRLKVSPSRLTLTSPL